jgi:hypothetical protein
MRHERWLRLYRFMTVVLAALTLTSCGFLRSRGEVVGEVGWSPPFIPIRIGVNTAGRVSATFAERIGTPLGIIDFGVSGSVPIKQEIDLLRRSDALKAKRVLIVRVDGQATIYELEPDRQFQVESVSSGAGYRSVGLTTEADGDIVLELESIKVSAAAPAPAPRAAPPSPIPVSTAACPRSEACIAYPQQNDRLSGVVAFQGTATRERFLYYKFEFRPETNPDYAYLVRFEAPVTNGILMDWDTRTVPSGAYWLRLIVVDNTGNYWPELAEVRVVVQN